MEIVCIVLTVLTSILLIVVVLVQKSKGGGLSSSFAGSNQIMGVRRTNDFIEKATWTLAGIILLLSILSVFCMPKAVTGSHVTPPAKTVVKGSETQAPAATPLAAPAAQEEGTPAATPAAPAQEPAAGE